MSAIDDIATELTAGFRQRDVWVFAGAGISFDAGLPVVNQLVPFILGQLGVSPKDTDIYMSSRFCFEEFMQTLLELSEQEDPLELLDIFAEGLPAANHTWLARLARRGYLTTVITTNFDALIEAAFEHEGLQREKDYQVLHREEDFTGVNWSD